jgi:CBS domain-containing protein
MEKKLLLVHDLMTTGAETIEPHDTLQYAAGRMKALGVGFLTVHSDADGVLGVITDRDIVVRGVAEGVNPEKTTARDIMTGHVVWCYDDTTVSEAARLMEARAVRRLVVLDHQHRLAGVLSIDDLARTEGVTWLAGEVLRRTVTA